MHVVFLAIKWPFFGQPDNQIDWATSTPFALIYPILTQESIPVILVKQYRELVDLKKLHFLNPSNSQIKKKHVSSPLKSGTDYGVE